MIWEAKNKKQSALNLDQCYKRTKAIFSVILTKEKVAPSVIANKDKNIRFGGEKEDFNFNYLSET